MKRLLALLILCAPLMAQVSPQIQGAGAPSNPCTNGGQQYVDQTNHAIYLCSVPGSNWVNIGQGNQQASVQYVTSAPSGSCSGVPPIQVLQSTGAVYTCQSGTWGTVGGGSGSGTVSPNNGSAGAVANYAAAAGSTTVGPDSLLTDNGTTLSYTGTGGLSLSTPLSPANGGGPVFSTAGVSEYLLPFGEVVNGMGVAASGTVGVTNRVMCEQITINGSVTFTKMMINVTTTSSTNHEYIGIYNAAGTSLLVQGTFTLTASTGNLSTTVGSTTLTAGQYRFCRSADQTTSAVNAIAANTVAAGMINANALREGVAANSTSGGVMPATTGAISAANEPGWIVLLEP